MKNFKNLLFVALFFVASTVLGQTKITGTIVDETNQPLPGASVLEKGTTNGVSTDFDGKFTLNAKSNSGTLVVSFIGYKVKEIIFSSAKPNIGNIKLAVDEGALEEIQIIASVAIDRKTPVAKSNISKKEILLKLGNQEFPEILKSTPGVFVTRSGGGFGDGEVTMRGFSSSNVALLINGIPVNDMENGAIYWSNWAGLGSVTSLAQTQRGLGAAKIAVPSIGGTINIITESTEAEKGGFFGFDVGFGYGSGYQKT
jgi:hypothetical protein